ncbi:hypothetical protein [Halobaculum lipolyticum]|uniref:Rubrerythrin-like domain-containing protein n=1 Tax=Halobaculum lipolyticum TaxID=3032001 RepID=A0ABD5W604_9EURY|nr:hypothetical protein [Halobaculum sp. DT31]
MLGLRYFVCERCDSVHSGLEEPAACARCAAVAFAELPAGTGADAYFTRGLRGDR